MNKVLMVEKEVGFVERVQKRLSNVGFEMLSAFDGRHGFQLAKEKAPNLIITDAIIPVMNGFEFCKAIKHDEDTKCIPIVVMTDRQCLEESFILLGIHDFLSKPIVMDDLERVVRKKLDVPQIVHLQKSKIFVVGRPEILSCCQQLLKDDINWMG